MFKLYNTLTAKKEIFRPRKDKKINLFVCGPTVYDHSHIGHARTYIIFDVIAKYLRQKGYDVFYLQNITDIDDKIINRAKERKVNPQKLAKSFEKEYLEDMKSLKVNSVSKYARATEHIKEIINQVGRLLKKGFAYKIEDGIYYDISKFKDYGKLSKRTMLQAEDSVSRIDESKGKKNKGDFCLWKFSKVGEPSWSSPFSKGRPGWHIEDTAICEKYFGPQYDIHGGARDLVFPHHEAEIAQMEAISGKKPLVKYWLHSGFLTVKGQKMAKSLGNFITIKDFLKENSSRLLRLLIVKTHYRSPIDYSEKAILQCKKELERIDDFTAKLIDLRNRYIDFVNRTIEIAKFEKEFNKAMEDDFNTPKAVAVIFDLINKSNSLISQNKLSFIEAKKILNFFKKIDKIFGLKIDIAKKNIIVRPKTLGLNLKIMAPAILDSKIVKLIERREKYRREDQWQKADEIRKKIEKMGYKIEDTKEGPKIKSIE